LFWPAIENAPLALAEGVTWGEVIARSVKVRPVQRQRLDLVLIERLGRAGSPRVDQRTRFAGDGHLLELHRRGDQLEVGRVALAQ
jgi:hypothetical protein